MSPDPTIPFFLFLSKPKVLRFVWLRWRNAECAHEDRPPIKKCFFILFMFLNLRDTNLKCLFWDIKHKTFYRSITTKFSNKTVHLDSQPMWTYLSQSGCYNLFSKSFALDCLIVKTLLDNSSVNCLIK